MMTIDNKVVKRNIWSWGIYDLANSIMTICFTMYFSQWIIIDNGVHDFWYGLVFSIATAAVLITSPFFGAWSDNIKQRKPFVTLFTIFISLSSIVLGIIAPSNLQQYLKIPLSLLMFFLFQYCYQLVLVFFNSMLYDISNKNNIGMLSGIGEFFNNFGTLIGLFLFLPIANGKFALLSGEMGRSQVFFAGALLSILLSLPMLFIYKEEKKKREKKYNMLNVKSIYLTFFKGLKNIIKHDKNVFRFLISFYFISDAVLTFGLYIAIYFSEVWMLSDTLKTLVLGVTFISLLPGTYIFGLLCQKYSPKKLYFFTASSLSIILIVISLIKANLVLLFIIFFIIGLTQGGLFTISRLLFINISPKDKLGEYFGYYSVFQRFASVIGPLIWGLTVFVLSKYPVMKYRVSVLFLGLIILLGIYFLVKVKEVKK